MNYFTGRRTSNVEVNKIYFWTATINNWAHLLKNEEFKKIIVNSLSYLSRKGLVDIFGFVIMPNHIRFIWRMNSLNGKETPFGSFLKFTAHEFKKKLSERDLILFKVNESNKQYKFWQRDSMAIELYSSDVAYQKLDYIHQNPLAKDWNLAEEPIEYPYSSASFYESGNKEFDFLKHLGEEF